MTRRCLVWIVCGLFLALACLGLVGCKEEEGTVQQETAAESEETVSKAATPDTARIENKTGDFEEEEGVQQESSSQYDY